MHGLWYGGGSNDSKRSEYVKLSRAGNRQIIKEIEIKNRLRVLGR